MNIISECLLWSLVCFKSVQAVLLHMWHKIIIIITTNKWWPDLLEVNCMLLKHYHYCGSFCDVDKHSDIHRKLIIWCNFGLKIAHMAKPVTYATVFENIFPYHENSSTKCLEIFGTSWGHQHEHSNLVTIAQNHQVIL